ncbi:hypothetical protein CHU98_g53 [Xylaria longipes]|nr:hypothetical protein CHU98_g53 [Xylaria longipes]
MMATAEDKPIETVAELATVRSVTGVPLQTLDNYSERSSGRRSDFNRNQMQQIQSLRQARTMEASAITVADGRRRTRH